MPHNVSDLSEKRMIAQMPPAMAVPGAAMHTTPCVLVQYCRRAALVVCAMRSSSRDASELRLSAEKHRSTACVFSPPPRTPKAVGAELADVGMALGKVTRAARILPRAPMASLLGCHRAPGRVSGSRLHLAAAVAPDGRGRT